MGDAVGNQAFLLLLLSTIVLLLVALCFRWNVFRSQKLRIRRKTKRRRVVEEVDLTISAGDYPTCFIDEEDVVSEREQDNRVVCSSMSSYGTTCDTNSFENTTLSDVTHSGAPETPKSVVSGAVIAGVVKPPGFYECSEDSSSEAQSDAIDSESESDNLKYVYYIVRKHIP